MKNWEMKITETQNEFTGLIMAESNEPTICGRVVCDTQVAFWYNALNRGVSPAICHPVIEQCKRDALLICAAPELLEACELLESFVSAQMKLGVGISAKSRESVSKARNAIQKAKGE